MTQKNKTLLIIGLLVTPLFVLSTIGIGLIGVGSFRTVSDVELGGQTAEKQIEIGILDSGDNYDLTHLSGETVDKALERLSIENEQFVYQYEEYPFGIFVTKINNLEPEDDQFWKFFVNGEESQVGVSDYVLNPGDKIEFKLEKIENYGN